LNAKIRAATRADDRQKYYFTSIEPSMWRCSTMPVDFSSWSENRVHTTRLRETQRERERTLLHRFHG